MSKFQPKPGQIDYTEARWAPVINCVVKHDGKYLLVKRSEENEHYPGFWNGISGFLDDDKSLEEKVREELLEETGIKEKDIISIELGIIFDQNDEEHKKTWVVHPVLVEIRTDKIEIDWEASEYKWVELDDIENYDLMPGFDKVIENCIH